MNTTATMGRLADMSPKTKARLVGVLLLITMVGGVLAQGFIGGRLIYPATPRPRQTTS